MAQKLFNTMDEKEDLTLTNFLNANEKGGDTMVIQLGSHSIKLGLASQMQPFLIPNIIAYPVNAQSDNQVFDKAESAIDEKI